jgi:AraC-like DNA-binding protein
MEHLPAEAKHWSRYETPSSAHRALGLWVDAVGYQRPKLQSDQLSERTWQYYCVLYISRGAGWFTSTPTGRIEVRAGTLLWLFPGISHGYGPSGGPWNEQWVTFSGPLADQYCQFGYIDPNRPVVEVGDDEEIAGLYRKLEDIFRRGGPLAVSLASSLVHQLIVLNHARLSGLADAEASGDRLVNDAVRIIEQEALKGLRPEDLAERLHASYPTLRRRFKQRTGFAVKEYMLNIQLRVARQLLAFTRKNVSEVAEETGFRDAFYFSRLFKARTGTSPREFREQQA